MKDFKISAICITKNEEKNILRSIESYKNIVDEIIIIDTGSIDNTVNICKELGCKVYEYKWEDDFSIARNQALEKAQYPYILFLDADEYFDPYLSIESKDILETIMKDESIEGLRFLCHNIDNKDNRNIYNSYNLKFFRNNKMLNYKKTESFLVFKLISLLSIL